MHTHTHSRHPKKTLSDAPRGRRSVGGLTSYSAAEQVTCLTRQTLQWHEEAIGQTWVAGRSLAARQQERWLLPHRSVVAVGATISSSYCVHCGSKGKGKRLRAVEVARSGRGARSATVQTKSDPDLSQRDANDLAALVVLQLKRRVRLRCVGEERSAVGVTWADLARLVSPSALTSHLADFSHTRSS